MWLRTLPGPRSQEIAALASGNQDNMRSIELALRANPHATDGTNPHRRQAGRTAVRPRCRCGGTESSTTQTHAVPPVPAQGRCRRCAHRRVARKSSQQKPAHNCSTASSKSAALAGKPNNSPSSRNKAKPHPKTGKPNTQSPSNPTPPICRRCRRDGCGQVRIFFTGNDDSMPSQKPIQTWWRSGFCEQCEYLRFDMTLKTRATDYNLIGRVGDACGPYLPDRWSCWLLVLTQYRQRRRLNLSDKAFAEWHWVNWNLGLGARRLLFEPIHRPKYHEDSIMPVPPIAEQFEVSIVRCVDDESRSLPTIEIALKQSAAQRKNILKAAFSGQLVPQDPNDEPASVLLERITRSALLMWRIEK